MSVLRWFKNLFSRPLGWLAFLWGLLVSCVGWVIHSLGTMIWDWTIGASFEQFPQAPGLLVAILDILALDELCTCAITFIGIYYAVRTWHIPFDWFLRIIGRQ